MSSSPVSHLVPEAGLIMAGLFKVVSSRLNLVGSRNSVLMEIYKTTTEHFAVIYPWSAGLQLVREPLASVNLRACKADKLEDDVIRIVPCKDTDSVSITLRIESTDCNADQLVDLLTPTTWSTCHVSRYCADGASANCSSGRTSPKRKHFDGLRFLPVLAEEDINEHAI